MIAWTIRFPNSVLGFWIACKADLLSHKIVAPRKIVDSQEQPNKFSGRQVR